MEWAKKAAVTIIVLAILSGCVLLIINRRKPTEIVISSQMTIDEKQVGVFGAVNLPGYYNYKGDIRIEEAAELAGGLSEDADISLSHLAKWVNDGETVIIPTIGPEQPTLTPVVPDEEKIDLNHASLEELMKLPGIGEKRASDIIELREKKGGFKSREEIMEISGIGESLLEKIYDRLIIR